MNNCTRPTQKFRINVLQGISRIALPLVDGRSSLGVSTELPLRDDTKQYRKRGALVPEDLPSPKIGYRWRTLREGDEFVRSLENAPFTETSTKTAGAGLNRRCLQQSIGKIDALHWM